MGASDRPPVMGVSGGGKPKNHPSPLSQSPWRPGVKEQEDHPAMPRGSFLNCPGRKPGVLVWTGAVST